MKVTITLAAALAVPVVTVSSTSGPKAVSVLTPTGAGAVEYRAPVEK